MMFNMKQHTKSAQKPYEKYHRDENLGPKANDNASIGEKQLPHRNGFEQTVTEDQMKNEHECGDTQKAKPIEKLLESATSTYVKHRSDAGDLVVPPLNALVAWNKNAPQHDKYVLNNDPDRFSGTNSDPVNFHTEKIQPLIGNVTTADVNKVADSIKTGESGEFDGAIMAILRLAHNEKRELSDVERKTIVDLKVARTEQMMQK